MRSLPTWIACAATLLVPLQAPAEGFADLYAGMAFTLEDDTTIDLGPEALGAGTLRDDTSFDPAVTGGGRIGWWTETASWLGLALDVSYLAPEEDDDDGKDLRTSIVPVSFLLMARRPLLADEDRPAGLFQPYLGLGAAFVFSQGKFDVNGARYEDRQFDFGFDGRAGLSVLFGEHVGLFAEYRFLYFRADYDDIAQDLAAQAQVQHLSNTVVGGITVRFGYPDD